jgi:hypothetical protein
MIPSSLLCLTLVAAAPAPSVQEALNAEQKKVFELIDSFDSLDTSKLPFVKTKITWRPFAFPGTPDEKYGFLVNETPDDVTIRFVDLTQQRVAKQGGGASSPTATPYEPTELANYVDILAARCIRERGERVLHHISPEEVMGGAGEGLLLARACARRGLDAEAKRAFKAIQTIDAGIDELARGLSAGLDLEFSDPSLSRAALLEHHRRWLKAFPEKRWYRESIVARERILARMVDEDAKRGAASRPSSKPTIDQDVDQLFVELRDQLEPPISEPSWDDGNYVGAPFSQAWSETAAGRLKGLGDAAVPRLIEALDDESLTRCVWYSCRHSGGFWVLPVREFASELLPRIAGVAFAVDRSEAKARWSEWWKSYREKGKEATIVEVVSRGDHSSQTCVRELLKKWPQRIGAAIEGARHANNSWVRGRLVRAIGESKEPQALEFLLEEVKTGPFARGRIEAARALNDRKNPAGLKAIVKEWESSAQPREARDPNVPPSAADFDHSSTIQEGRIAMATFLLESGDATAIDILGKDLASRPEEIKLATLEAIESGDRYSEEFPSRPEPGSVMDRKIEEILAELLRVTDRQVGLSGGRSMPDGTSVSYSDPRICDMAALEMASRWPDRYHFNPSDPTQTRDRAIVGIEKRWRRDRGLPPIPSASPSASRPANPEIPKILARLESESDAAAIRNYVAALESLGLDALPWIEEALEKFPNDRASRTALVELADRLANTVRDATLAADGFTSPAELDAKVNAMKGSRPSATALVQLWLDACAALPNGCGSVAFSAERAGDGTGVVIALHLTAGEGGKRVAAYHGSVMADRNSLFTGGGQSVRSRFAELDSHEDQQKAIEKALESPRKKSFEVHLDAKLQ